MSGEIVYAGIKNKKRKDKKKEKRHQDHKKSKKDKDKKNEIDIVVSENVTNIRVGNYVCILN